MSANLISAESPILTAALTGLFPADSEDFDPPARPQKTLPPWLFYDAPGSALFEHITQLPEYYLTRTERALFERHASALTARPATIVELGAGTATKTGILLRAAARTRGAVLYQPIDVSPSALDQARRLESEIPGLTVRPQVANYITEPYRIARLPGQPVLALYIGSSIGNFSPAEARAILSRLRAQLAPGDTLLLGTDLAPGPNKSVATLLAAYDDTAGITAAFNLNILAHLNRVLAADLKPAFNLDCFRHQARWNPAASRIEMHLQSLAAQTVHLAGRPIHLAEGETIHTENSYKFTPARLAALLTGASFTPTQTLEDPQGLYAVTLAQAT